MQTADATPQSLTTLMVGRDIRVRRDRSAAPESAPALEVENVWAENDRAASPVRRVAEVRAGEIVGIAGVTGNGQRELAEAFAGRGPARKGRSRPGHAGAPGRRAVGVDAGIGYVPEDRLAPASRRASRSPSTLRSSRFAAAATAVPATADDARDAAAAIQTFEVKAAGPHQQTDYLSGGNLQKLVLAREFAASPASSSPPHRRAASTSPRSSRCIRSFSGRRRRRGGPADQRGSRRDPGAEPPGPGHVRGHAQGGGAGCRR